MSTRELVIYPYLITTAFGDTWVFDDSRTGLKEEAFVLGMSEMITRVVTEKNILDADNGFDLVFSDTPFDGHDVCIRKTYPDSGGTWYTGNIFGTEMTGWLCPALFLYFADAPEYIYMAAKSLSPGVIPIWEPEGAYTRQFVSAPR
jgi:hypothetical protein